MKKFTLTLCLMLAGFVATAEAQFFKSETTSKAGERMRRGDHAGAIAVLDKAIESGKDLLEAHQMRANLRSRGGDLDGAIADYTAALEINPNDAVTYERRAMFRMFKRDYAGAIKDLDAAIANGLKTERVYEKRAAVKRDMGDFEGAMADYQTALAVNPNLAAAHNGLAFTLEKRGDADAAVAHLQGFLDRYEAARDGKLPSVKGGTAVGETVTIKRPGRGPDSSQGFMIGGQIGQPFTANSPEDMERQQARFEQVMNLALAYAHLGRLYAKKGDFEKALGNYEKGLQVRKGDPYIHKLRSEIRIKQGDLQGAIADLTVAANSPMGAPDSHFDKGLLLLLQGKDAEAQKEFDLHLQRFPDGRESLNKRIEEAKKLRSQPSR